MSKVYVTTYEAIGEGLAIAERHYDQVESAREAHWKWVESLGGNGFRPDRNGGLRSVFFAGALPTGWRRLAKVKDRTEAVPNRGTKSGKAAEEEMAAVPCAPTPAMLAEAFGYSPTDMALDSERGTIHFPTELQVLFPAKRTFLRLPRFAKDGFTPDDAILRALPESELMAALEGHNAEVARRKKETA